jgi:NAD(P) transhydrogenase subunit beta
LNNVLQLAYLLTALLFILGLRRMSAPSTARGGITLAGWGMILAVVASLLVLAVTAKQEGPPGLVNFGLLALALVLGTLISWIAACRVAMTDMPQMVALFNGMGGGAAAAIAAVEILGGLQGGLLALALLGALIGAISFGGSLMAFAKLQGLINTRPIVFPAQRPLNLLILILALALGALLLVGSHPGLIGAYFLLTLAFGILMTLPIGGGDMPVLISLFNALTGLAVGFEGFAIGNPALIVAGTVVGAAGTLLTVLMAKAMNRSISSVLLGGFGQEQAQGSVEGSLKPIDVEDAAILLGYAGKVIMVPGYGMALAQAQHKLRELADLLEARGVEVKYAIHPVAGRMPGHMNVLLAEAGVAYEKLFDLEEINPEFASADVAVVIGANDVVNPAARRPGSPLYGMPILAVDQAKNVLVLKRGQGRGFAGVENELFYLPQTRMLYGDAQETLSRLVQALKKL